MDALDLHVEQGRRIDADLKPLGDQPRQGFLGGSALGGEAVLEGGVGRQRLDPAQRVGIVEDLRSRRLGEEVAQARVCLMQPAPEGDAVGLVDDAVRIERVQVLEDGLAHELGVKRRDAVDLVRAEEGEVPHAHPPLLRLVDQRHGRDGAGVERPGPLRELLQVEPVDQVDDLHVARQQPLQHGDRPGLERFRQERVVGVAEGPRGDRPGFLPGAARARRRGAA